MEAFELFRPSCQGHPPVSSKPIIFQQLVVCSGRFCMFVCLFIGVLMWQALDGNTPLKSLCSFHSVYLTMLMTIDVTLIILQC